MDRTHDCYGRETFFATAVALRGQDGKEGVGVQKVEIREGHLYVTLTDGKESDAGVVVSQETLVAAVQSVSYTKTEIDDAISSAITKALNTAV